MKKSLFLLGSFLTLQTGTALAQAMPSEEQIIAETTEIGRLRAQELSRENFFGLFSPFNRCRYAIKTPDKVTRGTVALTFDDGPHPTITPKILDALKAHRAQATFFVMGGKIKGNEAILRRILDEGHLLANHSYSHKNFHTASSSVKESEVVSTHKLLSNFIHPRFFRYPYGNSTCDANTMIENLGYNIVGWNIDTCDWAFSDGYLSDKENEVCAAPTSLRRDFFGYVRLQTQRTQGGILLMHDVHQATADNLHNLLTMLENDGYRFVTLDDVNVFPLLNKR